MINAMTVIYLAIAAMVFVSVFYNMVFREEKLVDQITAAMILVPLALRILLIK